MYRSPLEDVVGVRLDKGWRRGSVSKPVPRMMKSVSRRRPLVIVKMSPSAFFHLIDRHAEMKVSILMATDPQRRAARCRVWATLL